jgi:DNA-binding NtrC family response regulator
MILLVEADDDVRLLMSVALRRLGYSVIDAPTVTDACARFGNANGTVALLLSEAVLPDGTGADLYRILASVDSRLRLLLVSGERELASIGSVAGNPAAECMLKPFSLDALTEKVGDALRSRADVEPVPVRSRALSALCVR